MTRVDQLVAGFRREAALRRRFTWAVRLGSITFAGLFLYYTMALARWDVFYLTLCFASTATGLSGLVVMLYFEVPAVVRALHSAEPAEADAAWAAIEQLRPELLPGLFADVGVRPEEHQALVGTIDRPALLTLTAARAHDRWRTVGPYYLVGYLIALGLYLLVLVTFEPETIP